MSDLKRYEVEISGELIDAYECDDGEWVKAEDVEKLTSDLAESQAEVGSLRENVEHLREEIERLRESLRYFYDLPLHPTVWLSEHFIEKAKAHELLSKEGDGVSDE